MTLRPKSLFTKKKSAVPGFFCCRLVAESILVCFFGTTISRAKMAKTIGAAIAPEMLWARAS
jgi:hypothetical protein